MIALGDSPLRLEDRSLVTGSGAYVADLVDADTLHCAFVRSPVAHGSFVPPPVDEALGMPGVVAVYRAADLGLPDLPSAQGPGAPEGRGMGQPPLAWDRVRHVGDPIVVVVAETAAQAVDAAGQIWVDIDPLPAVTDVISALADATLLFPEAGTNLVLDETVGSTGPRPEVARQTSVEIEIPRLSPVTLEPLAILAKPVGSGLELWCGHQAPWRLPRLLGPLLGMAPGSVRARVPDVGGAFGTKGPFYPEYAVVAAVARDLLQPVVWLQGRREQLESGTHGRGQTVRVDIGGDDDGKIRFFSSEILGDVGAYPASGAQVPTFSRLVAQGPYDIEHLRVRVRVAVTNRAPTGPYRGAGRPEAAIAMERAVDAFAVEVGLAPEVVRARNLIPSADLPYTSETGAIYDSGDYAAALDLALETLDVDGWRDEQRRRSTSGADPIGIGIACFIERAGGAIDSGEWGRVELLADGSVVVRTGSTPSGQAHRTVWSQIAASVFSVPIDRIVFVAGDTAKVADGVGSFGSRSLQVGGSAILRTATEVRGRAARVAADLLEAAEADLELVDGVFSVTGSPGSAVTLAEVVEHAVSMGIDLWSEEMFTPGAQTFPYGTHAAVVEVELETGQVSLLQLVVVDDCGNVIHPMVVEGQVHGSVMQGIGEALLECVVYDDDGQLLSANMTTYLIPSATQPMPLTTRRLVHPAPSNPLGAKGTGETGCIGVPPAILNAVHDALRPLGVRSLNFPLNAPRVWQAIQDARR
ncbi:MAG TPA: xanthine dehydrogenase family protein molybdopterin-binding subunit [Acidimicrobiia bacterium]|nr:xanthine dehydrogenase family protein molybdopterin-binding subunit [Acidimicrobiia bacterium]